MVNPITTQPNATTTNVSPTRKAEAPAPAPSHPAEAAPTVGSADHSATYLAASAAQAVYARYHVGPDTASASTATSAPAASTPGSTGTSSGAGDYGVLTGKSGGPPLSTPSSVPQPFQNGPQQVKSDVGPVPANPAKVDVGVKIGKPSSTKIKGGFAGLSYDSYILNQDPKYFTPKNTQLINTFKQMGIKNLRVGGDTADFMKQKPTTAEIDNLFKFAQQVPGLKVDYMVGMINGHPDQEAQTVSHIWKNYPKQVSSFSIGNEPNLPWFKDKNVQWTGGQDGTKKTDFPSYMNRWLQFAHAVNKAAPGAPLSGPDTAIPSGDPNNRFDQEFVQAAKKDGVNVGTINTHDYIEGEPKKTTADSVQDILSPQATEREEAFNKNVAAPLEKDGDKVQMTETNSELIGNHGSTDAQAGALFDENELFQLASGGVQDADFHTLRPFTRTIYQDNNSNGNVGTNPSALAVAAFNHFGQGNITPVDLHNPDGVNLNAYAVTHDNKDVTLALINQTYGPDGKTANVGLAAPNGGSVAYLQAPHDNVEANTGVTLGGGQITDSNGSLDIQQKELHANDDGNLQVDVPPASVAFVTLPYSRLAEMEKSDN